MSSGKNVVLFVGWSFESSQPLELTSRLSADFFVMYTNRHHQAITVSAQCNHNICDTGKSEAEFANELIHVSGYQQ